MFGDPEISLAESPVYAFHDHMDEAYITDLPEKFPCEELQMAFERIAHQKIPDLPEGIWFAGLDDNRKTTMQMIFADVVRRDVAIDAIMQAVDTVLAQNDYNLGDLAYGVTPMTRQNYDEALIYMQSLTGPSASPK